MPDHAVYWFIRISDITTTEHLMNKSHTSYNPILDIWSSLLIKQSWLSPSILTLLQIWTWSNDEMVSKKVWLTLRMVPFSLRENRIWNSWTCTLYAVSILLSMEKWLESEDFPLRIMNVCIHWYSTWIIDGASCYIYCNYKAYIKW